MKRARGMTGRTILQRVVQTAVTFIAVTGSVFPQTSWEWQNPFPTGNGLTAARYISGGTCVVVGENATVLRTIDNGVHWEVLSCVANRSATLNALDFADSSFGIAVGDSGVMVKSTDGGRVWTPLYSGTMASLRGIDMIDHANAVAVGTNGTILTTRDGGALWTEQTLLPGLVLHDVSFVNHNLGIAVGDQGVVARSTDGGDSWESRSLTPHHLNAISWIDELTVVAVGGSDRNLITGLTYAMVLRSTDSGLSWDSLHPADTEVLVDVTTLRDGSGLAASAAYQVNSAILRTTNGGLTWVRTPDFPGYTSIAGTALSDPLMGMAVGENSLCITTDGGQSWVSQRQDSARVQLAAIALVSPLVAFIAGGPEDPWYAVVLATGDGGSTWNRRYAGDSPNRILRSISAPDENTAIAVGDYGLSVYKTTDGGGTWAAYSTGFDRYWYGVSFCDPQTGTVVGSEGTILRTTDGGSDFSWVQQSSGTSEHLWDVAQLSPEVAWVVGSGGTILRTSNGGSTWSAQTSGTTATIRSLSALDASNAFALSDRDTLLRTTNGGATWESRPIANVRGAMLMDVAASGPEEALVVGTTGTVLRTTDYGVSWTTPMSGTSDELWSVDLLPGTGIGSVVGYRGTILRTTNGGATWVKGRGVENLPRDVGLSQNYPNPFNPKTTIPYRIPAAGDVRLAVYDLLGREVVVLVDEKKAAGSYEVRFDAAGLASGVYLYRLQAGAFLQTKRLLLLK